MRFPKQPLVVGSPVMPNAADVAAGLKVEWRRDEKEKMAVAIIDDVMLRTRDDGWWGVHRHSVATGPGVIIKCGSDRNGGAKRAAVLALASHLVDTMARALDVVGGAAGAEACDCADFGADSKQSHYSWCETPTTLFPATKTADPKAVEARGFKVGDRVKQKMGNSPRHRGVIVSDACPKWGADNVVILDEEGDRRTWPITILEHVDAPSAGLVSFEWEDFRMSTRRCAVTNPTNAHQWIMMVDVGGGGVMGPCEWFANPSSLTGWASRGIAPTLDEAKRAAEAAFLAAKR